MDTFSEVNITPITTGGSTKAVGNVLVAGTIKVNFRVVEKKAGGLFAALPSRSTKKPDGTFEFRDEVFIPDKATREELNSVVIAAYESKINGGSSASNDFGPPPSDDDVPF